MNILTKIFLGSIVSFYFFPIGFSFLPANVNTKMILAVLGIALFLFDNLRFSELRVSYNLLASFMLAIVFSSICYYSTEYNNTIDYSYATYIVSFFVWLGGAYSVSWFFKMFYGEFSFRQFSFYVIGVCVTQCILALLIDNIPVFKGLVDAVVLQGQDFLDEVDRLYGIGAALDTAGVRFSIVLLLAANLIIKDNYVRDNSRVYFLILMSFFFIGVVGNMISRTTVIGLGLGFAYLLYASGIIKSVIQYKSFKSTLIFILILGFIIFMAMYIYNTSAEYRKTLRFAFEGFFNWYESGVWRTQSTDKLNTEMWIWPQDTKSWLIGTGIFGFFVYSTDIGYCRFVLYCGLIGFTSFALLFVYNSIAFMIKVPQYRTMFFILGVLPFIIWLKVATDIFFIYALFYCMDSFTITNGKNIIAVDENSV